MTSSRPISYLTMKCVLKYLDPSLRFQLSTTCPSIQNLEKSIPMHIKYLKLTDNNITVNQSIYQLSVRDETNKKYRFHAKRARYNESSGWLNSNVPGGSYIQLKVGGKVEVLRYGRKMDEAMKYLIGRLFGGRNVKVLRLAIGCETIIRIPSTLKFHIQVLDVLDKKVNASLDTVRLMLDESCLPLTLIVFWLKTIFNYTDPLIDTAQIVVFLSPETSSHNLLKLAARNHNRVHVTRLLQWGSHEFCVIAEHWMSNDKDVGTYFTFETTEKKIYAAMAHIRKTFEHRVEARSPSDNNQFALNMNDASNLVISKAPEGNVWVLGMRVENRRHL